MPHSSRSPVTVRSRTRARWIVAALLSACAAHAVDLSKRIEFNIPPQSLSTALIEFSHQAQIQIVISDDLGQTGTSGVSGPHAISQALAQLLGQSGLSYRVVSDTAITIGHADKSAGATRAGTTPASWRVAQLAAQTSDTATGGGATGPVADSAAGNGAPPVLEEVVVTGTHIRGAEPAGSSLKTYAHEDIVRSGAATIDQFARQMVENFSGADGVANQNTNIAFSRFNGGGINNGLAGAAFDLHGLGPSSTLTLLNGHRLAPGGFDGSLVDISQIPLSAVDHIEVLGDGASAIYGADAVAGVVNLVTRKDFQGAQSTVRYGAATAGGAAEFTGSQLLGTSWGGGNVLINYEYDRQSGLNADERDYIPDQGGVTNLLPRNQRNSLLLAGSQSLSESTSLSFDAMLSNRDFGSDQFLNSSIEYASTDYSGSVKQFGGTLTLEQRLAADWNADLTGSFSRLEQTYDTAADAVIPNIFTQHATQLESIDSSVGGFDLVATGPLFSLPAGAVKAAVGASYRRETFAVDSQQTINGSLYPVVVPTLSRHVTSLYAEASLPLLARDQASTGGQRLELSLAGRYDRYSDFGSTTNPRIGLTWEPVAGFDLRGSFGKSFQAPLLNQIGAPLQVNVNYVPNPSAPLGLTDTVLLNGGNPGLRPERSTSYTAGFDLKPVAVPAFTLAATYFHIDFKSRISVPPIVGGNYFNDPAIASFVTLNPPLALVDSYYKSPGFGGDTTGNGETGVEAIFDSRSANIASSIESGVTVNTAYDLASSVGHFVFSAAASRLLTNRFEAVAGTPDVELLDTFGEPTRWKARGGVAWNTSHYAAQLSLNYANSYDNSLFTPAHPIDSWLTEDLFLSYSGGTDSPLLLHNLRVTLSVQNITDKKPPFIALPPEYLLPGQKPLPYDSVNASPIGRFISMQLSKQW